MLANTALLPAARTTSASAPWTLRVDERDRSTAGLALPSPEVHIVVRFGAVAAGSLDIHALGARQRVVRKVLRGGQRVVMARLALSTTEAVLAVPASALAGRTVAIDALWGDVAATQLSEQLAGARSTRDAATILERAIAERTARSTGRTTNAQLVLAAADRLARESVGAIATDLGLSERHLRRIFGELVGMSPKAFARIARFRRAVAAASEPSPASWASVATRAGYYDQAHLIADFRAIAGVTPRALLGELRAAPPVG